MTTTEIDELGRAAEARMERMDRVAVLYAEITAASHEFLKALAETDRNRDWAEEGYQSCADWLAWRLGITRHTLDRAGEEKAERLHHRMRRFSIFPDGEGATGRRPSRAAPAPRRRARFGRRAGARSRSTASRGCASCTTPAGTARRLACDCSVVEVAKGRDGSVLHVGRRMRTVPPALRRALEVRDRGCRFPGCGVRFTDAHHIVHWADGGETSLENTLLLCRIHHRYVHEGGWRTASDTEGKAVFFSPLGKACGSAPPMPATDADALLRRNRERGVVPDWRMNLPPAA